MNQKEFYNIIDILRDITHGTQYDGKVYAVGGCVRDHILGRDIKDIDLCVESPNGGLDFAKFMRDRGYVPKIFTYDTYGTAAFELENEIIEVVQTRGEQYRSLDSRKPVVEYAPLNKDAMRRDLTINALYIRISDGEILDPTGLGKSDLENHIIRVASEDKHIVYNQDALRILRTIRFACRFGYEIEPETWKALVDCVPQLGTQNTSQERITDEFNKILCTDHPGDGLRLLKESGAMHYVIPEIEPTYEMEQNGYHFGSVWEHTVALLDYVGKHYSVKEADYVERMACVLHDIGKIKARTFDENGMVHFYGHENYSADMAKEIMHRMRYPNYDINVVTEIVALHMRTKKWGNNLENMKLKHLRELRYECGNNWDSLMIVIDADNNSHAKEKCMPEQIDNLRAYIEEERKNGDADYVVRMNRYKLPLNGNDIMEEFGIEPGPMVKSMLNHCIKLAMSDPDKDKEWFMNRLHYDKICSTD